jgi:hypothetical protein
MKVKHFKIGWFFGVSYFKDDYKHPFGGHTYNIILPFIRISWGELKEST